LGRRAQGRSCAGVTAGLAAAVARAHRGEDGADLWGRLVSGEKRRGAGLGCGGKRERAVAVADLRAQEGRRDACWVAVGRGHAGMGDLGWSGA